MHALILLCVSLAAARQNGSSRKLEGTKPPFKLDITANRDKNHSDSWDFANSAQTVIKSGSMLVIAIRKGPNIVDSPKPRRPIYGGSRGLQAPEKKLKSKSALAAGLPRSSPLPTFPKGGSSMFKPSQDKHLQL